jgi:hypothetical protein
MANKQINELSELTTASGTDYLVVYDRNESGSEKTKKMTKNNFMDYEEGTVTITAADAPSGGNTSTTGNMYYKKIGGVITCIGSISNIDTTPLTSGNDFIIRGFPYPNQAGIQANAAPRTRYITYSTSVTLTIPGGGVDYAKITENRSGDANDTIKVSELTDGEAGIWFTITYFTD